MERELIQLQRQWIFGRAPKTKLVRAAFPDPLRAQNPRARNQRASFPVGRWFPRADAYAHARRLASSEGVLLHVFTLPRQCL